MQYIISSLLYATDLGPRGPEVFRYATSLAEHYGSRIHLLHVIEPPQVFRESLADRYLSTEAAAALKEWGHDEARTELEARLERFSQSVMAAEKANRASVADIRVLSGSPAQVILDEARRIKADCIVLGSNHHSAFEGMVIGSVARKVTMASPYPVFLVPT